MNTIVVALAFTVIIPSPITGRQFYNRTKKAVDQHAHLHLHRFRTCYIPGKTSSYVDETPYNGACYIDFIITKVDALSELFVAWDNILTEAEDKVT